MLKFKIALQIWFAFSILTHSFKFSKVNNNVLYQKNIHTPPMEGFLNWSPHPSRNYILVSHFRSKNWDSETPLTFGISVWNLYTINVEYMSCYGTNFSWQLLPFSLTNETIFYFSFYRKKLNRMLSNKSGSCQCSWCGTTYWEKKD